jgi:hypothetical protein
MNDCHRKVFRIAVVFLGWGTLIACGYQPEVGQSSSQHYAVAAGRTSVPDPTMLPDVLLSARSELANHQALASDPFPRLVIELVALEERASGLQATVQRPIGRSTTLNLAGRAWLQREPDGKSCWDSGVIWVSDSYQVAEGFQRDTLDRDDLRRSLARRLGQQLMSKVLGLPAPQSPRL